MKPFPNHIKLGEKKKSSGAISQSLQASPSWLHVRKRQNKEKAEVTIPTLLMKHFKISKIDQSAIQLNERNKNKT